MKETLIGLEGCINIATSESSIILICDSKASAIKLNNTRHEELSTLAEKMGKQKTILQTREGVKIEIPSLSVKRKHSQERTFAEIIQLASQLSPFTIQDVAEVCRINPTLNDAAISFLALSDKNRACWVVDQTTQEVFVANEVALIANEKPPREVVMADMSALWEEDSLKDVVRLIKKDKVVQLHENRGFRWKRNGEWYERRSHIFHGDYAEITYMGRPARFEIVQAAIPA